MKTLSMILATAALFFAPAADALLPPLYSSITEYKELINSQELGKKLDSGEAINDIERTDSGFLIITNKSKLVVDIIREKQDKPGPAKFRLEFHDKEPL